MPKLDYVELPVATAENAVRFYSEAFGWDFTRYGPGYASYEGGPSHLGLDGTDDPKKAAAILPVIRVENLEDAYSSVVAAGGTVSQEIFAFPGGRRFHFTDPDGHELGCYQPA
ncbi:hypothetical protein AAV99_10080 [Aurantiacibacter marinus]|uniref:VOC domain-containing protein n=1 Tax=Aurantiacibacter marinus TaxID=874156 RepID=A0A0H0XPS5_9SPHN|nr:hypothetical protein AAV99_10080 [Aurantiacibacter marinus]